MSSFVRRIQKGIAKAQGFRRAYENVMTTDSTGIVHYHTVPVIRNSNDETVGTRWPQVKAPTKGAA